MVRNIDPLIVMAWRESKGFFINTCVFLGFALVIFWLRKCRDRHGIGFLAQVGFLGINLTSLILIARQWHSYHIGFVALAGENSGLIDREITIMDRMDTAFLSCISATTTVWMVVVMYKQSKQKEPESRGVKEAMAQLLLIVSWVLTLLVVQAKLPQAQYKNMPGAELYIPTSFEMDLEALTDQWFATGLYGRLFVWVAALILADTLACTMIKGVSLLISNFSPMIRDIKMKARCRKKHRRAKSKRHTGIAAKSHAAVFPGGAPSARRKVLPAWLNVRDDKDVDIELQLPPPVAQRYSSSMSETSTLFASQEDISELQYL
ncbi:hypothetical protein PRK78_001845 [Emydomyces testavorans]|uniref:Uncharacterized protein n=1 Tax=Emydomyces testavorans TaxID=2070801 RepID=A0AAF0DDE0_9EURO|nr:hypothetical protein PRK78_001845 [Emydomyces testavorans]